MKTLIVYSSKSGAAEACSAVLKSKIKNAVVVNLGKETPDLEGFDRIVIGSGIRLGKIYKPVRNFIQDNFEQLLTKKTAFYFCNYTESEFQMAADKNIPKPLKESALAVVSLGGKKPFGKYGNDSEWINENEINNLIKAIEK